MTEMWPFLIAVAVPLGLAYALDLLIGKPKTQSSKENLNA
jgi:hypothetical protein